MSKQAPSGGGHTKKHVPPRKHARGKAKHHPKGGAAGATMHHGPVMAPPKSAPVKAKHPKHPKARGLALADAIACCAAEALAASLRLAGQPVSDDDVLELYWRTAADEDAGASILATLEAAAEFGLAGCRPARFGLSQFVGNGALFTEQPLTDQENKGSLAAPFAHDKHLASVILGMELPGSHTVCATGDTWWSWGRPWDRSAFPAARIEEAWAVTW